MSNINNVLITVFIILTGMVFAVLCTGKSCIIVGYKIDMLSIVAIDTFIGAMILYHIVRGRN